MTYCMIILSQFKPHVKDSKAKKVAENHDQLALVANSYAHPSQSHASLSYSHSPQPYYVTHPSYVIDYEDDYQREIQGDGKEDKLLTLKELNATVIMMARIQPTDDKSDTEPTYDVELISEDFKVREDVYLDDIVTLEEKLKSHERVVFKISHSPQTILMLGIKPNSFYDPNMEAGFGYMSPKHLKKTIEAQLKMYNGKNLKYHDLKVNLPVSEKTFEDVKKVN
uniref:Uncharacterized protein n=1 Tax=Tanacetum cinerariifolium TaxID=118510 RepID=A0A6L2LWI5_TANCI|nr:hypothetical protein [Tanacetum cinerariifolium]